CWAQPLPSSVCMPHPLPGPRSVMLQHTVVILWGNLWGALWVPAPCTPAMPSSWPLASWQDSGLPWLQVC
ncbi:hypothetical protein HaLaN_15605, partial [Haematococcus lacustris]